MVLLKMSPEVTVCLESVGQEVAEGWPDSQTYNETTSRISKV